MTIYEVRAAFQVEAESPEAAEDIVLERLHADYGNWHGVYGFVAGNAWPHPRPDDSWLYHDEEERRTIRTKP